MEDFDSKSTELHLVIKTLSELAERATTRIETRDVFSLQPSFRKPASDALETHIRQLTGIVTLCQSATHELASILVRVQRAQHDCQLALAPISILPPEILTMIFQHAILPSSSPNPASSISVLSRVCSKWRGVADACTALWTDFTVDQHTPLGIYKKHLEHAGKRLLGLTVRDAVPQMPYEQIVGGLENVDRIWWASRTDPFYKLFRQYPALPFRLRYFAMRVAECSLCERHEDSSQVMARKSLKFEQLEYLRLEGANFRSLSITAPLLVSLHLKDTLIETSALDALLNSSQTLVSLVIEGPMGPDIEAPPMTFDLPRLRTLSVRHLLFHEAEVLLVPTKFPVLRRLEYVDHWSDGIHTANLVGEFLRRCAGLQHLSANCFSTTLNGICSALAPGFDTPDSSSNSSPQSPHPCAVPHLRTLGIFNYPFHELGEEQVNFHLEEQRNIPLGVRRTLQRRASLGCSSLQTLIICRCEICGSSANVSLADGGDAIESTDDVIDSLRNLVDELTVNRCITATHDEENDDFFMDNSHVEF